MKVLHISIDQGNYSVVGVNGHVVVSKISAACCNVDTLAVARNIAEALDVPLHEITMDEPRSAAWTFETVVAKAGKDKS